MLWQSSPGQRTKLQINVDIGIKILGPNLTHSTGSKAEAPRWDWAGKRGGVGEGWRTIPQQPREQVPAWPGGAFGPAADPAATALLEQLPCGNCYCKHDWALTWALFLSFGWIFRPIQLQGTCSLLSFVPKLETSSSAVPHKAITQELWLFGRPSKELPASRNERHVG